MPNANAYIDYWLNGNVSFVRFLLKPHCTISFMCTDFLEFYKMDTYIYIWGSLKIPDPHIFSYPLADSFEYLLCQQTAPTPQLYSWHITKVCLQTIKNS